MNTYIRSVLLALTITAVPTTFYACGRDAAHSDDTVKGDTARVAETMLMPLPVIPDSIFDPMQRADYVVLHYWDALSPDDPKATDREFIDANFAQYAEQFNYASEEGASYAVGVLIDQTVNYPEHLKLLGDMAIKHFGSRGSKTFSDRSLIIWMRELASAGNLDSALKSKYKFMLDAASKNAPGKKAADIRFSTKGGKVMSLYGLPQVAYTLLVLYDPDCETCHEILERVKGDKRLAKPVDSGQVRVVLIDVAESRSRFEYDTTIYPDKWIVGYDESRVEDNDIYIFESTPAIYLLDKNNEVILKDATIDDLIDYAKSVAG